MYNLEKNLFETTKYLVDLFNQHVCKCICVYQCIHLLHSTILVLNETNFSLSVSLMRWSLANSIFMWNRDAKCFCTQKREKPANYHLWHKLSVLSFSYTLALSCYLTIFRSNLLFISCIPPFGSILPTFQFPHCSRFLM